MLTALATKNKQVKQEKHWHLSLATANSSLSIECGMPFFFLKYTFIKSFVLEMQCGGISLAKLDIKLLTVTS